MHIDWANRQPGGSGCGAGEESKKRELDYEGGNSVSGIEKQTRVFHVYLTTRRILLSVIHPLDLIIVGGGRRMDEELLVLYS